MAIRLNHTDDGLPENHDINVTPFIDVILVLLIIFMVTAPLTTVDLPIRLPVSSAALQERQPDPVFVTLKADLSVAIGNRNVSRANLGAAVAAATKGNNDTQIFLRADKRIDYGQLMDLLNVLRNAGFLKVALVGLPAAASDDQVDDASQR